MAEKNRGGGVEEGNEVRVKDRFIGKEREMKTISGKHEAKRRMGRGDWTGKKRAKLLRSRVI